MRRLVVILCLPFIAIIGASAFASEPTTPAPATVAADRGQDMVCRREKETGSLVKSRKTCHSRAQWAYIDGVNQAQTRTMSDDMRTKSGSN